MKEQALALALKLAGHIGHPFAVAVASLVIAASVFAYAFYSKRFILAWIAAPAIIMLGIAPFAVSRFLQTSGVYHVEVIVVRPDQSLADIAQVKSSNRGELKMIAGGWQLDISPEARPADGKVTLSASVKDEFLNGTSTLVLAQDYYPTARIQLVADTSAMARGVVVNEDLTAIAGATVSIAGYSDVAVTDQKGNFVLPAHAGKGQMVEISAQKGQLSGRLSAPAGKVVEVIIAQE